jgi:L-fucose mutarotase
VLKNLHPLLTADLLYALAAMGHGDELAIVDNNFPASSHGQRLIRLDGVGIRAAGEAILSVFPLDTFVDEPLLRMEVVGAADEVPAVQTEFIQLATEIESRDILVASLSRNAFYERARNAFAIVATGEPRAYGCFLLVKGVTYANQAN